MVCVCMYVCIYVHVCICTYIYICIFIYVYIYASIICACSDGFSVLMEPPSQIILPDTN